MRILSSIVLLSILVFFPAFAQRKSLVNTVDSPHAKLASVNLNDVEWTQGFWAERFTICKDSMIPSMWKTFNDPNISHSYRNFEIAAGLETGNHEGPPFHDGDFYKWLEGVAAVYAVTKDPKLVKLMDGIIVTIARCQREDGYIHTPVIIKERQSGKKTEFEDRLNFETYNFGHLMTAACVHYRATGKSSLLNVAIKATDYLYNFYKRSSPELARNAICPSHYMGVIEMYRTTRDPKYLELAQNLIDIRGLVQDGTDDNQDRIPFRKQRKAVGHAVRANYLYAGVTDVYAETGEDSLMNCLQSIWSDIVTRKMYIIGACGALYDGTSPDGTSYQPSEVQKVHQAYGRDYQLPNTTAHNESCANIGNLLWNWRMLQVTADAKYADIMEQTLYNSILAGVSLDGKRYFYTNPLSVNKDLPYTLRWSKEREEYIKLCNCCPPNTIRTIAEVSNYVYSISGQGIYCNLYGGNKLNTKLPDGTPIELTEQTNYPWDGNIQITFEQPAGKDMSLFLRIPGWCDSASILLNGEKLKKEVVPGNYAEISRNWKKGDKVQLILPLKVKLIESNPLVEETRNQVAVRRGPIVYCLESPDINQGRIFDISIPLNPSLEPKPFLIGRFTLVSLEGKAYMLPHAAWTNKLYQEVSTQKPALVPVRLIPYYAWGNRGKSEMSVWISLFR